MILVDSSAWIEYYRPRGKPDVQAIIAEVISMDQAAVNGIIQVEILAFANDETERKLLQSDFGAFHRLPLTVEDFDLACSLGYDLRRRGVTVPATDLIIAASAIRAEAGLYHLDDHFSRIGEISELTERHLLVGEV